jgi:RimJ/RimL family protein N-acetyltransferase
MSAFRQSQSGTLVFGRVKSDNVPSTKVFEHLGFTKTGGREIIYRGLL